MQKKYYFGVVLVALAAGLLAFTLPNSTNSKEITLNAENTAILALISDSAETELKWHSVMESIALQETEKKKVFIDVYTSWCGPCKMLEANTFSNPVIKQLLNKYYLPTKFNAECNEIIEFKGQTFINKNYSEQPRKSTHDFAVYIASTSSGLGYPTMVFLDEELNMIQPLAGYLTPQQLEPILVYFGTDANKTIEWPAFLASYKPMISQ